jgi:uncharacterized repeat protein (TIGR01451 family)
MKKLLAIALATLLARPALAASACTNPGKDGPAPSLSGVVNSYYPGSGTASAGSTSVAVGAIDTSGGGSSKAISAGDLVMIVQMQDADISTSNDSSYGGSAPGQGMVALNGAGLYEYATVAPSYAGGSPVLLASPLVNTYRTQGVGASSGQRTFQVIRVPQYSSAVFGGTINAAGWNGATGGVAVVDVAGQLSWNSGAIDVTGRGFRGGGGLWMQGHGAGQATTWAATDYVTNLTGNLPTITPNPSTTAGPFPGSNGVKGEGIAGTPRYLFVPTSVGAATNAGGSLLDTGVEGYPNGSLARGAPGNAGGGGTDGDPQTNSTGGNDQNTGGGGGAGYATGGMGGFGWTPGTPPGSPTGGFGGQGVPMSAARLTMGGGGGAGTTNNATGTPGYGLATSGAPGGGLVLVRAKTFTGAGTINANGTSGNQSVCNDASGGGGGGGAVLLYASGGSGAVGTVTINANGGVGGSNTGNGTGNNSGVCGPYNNQPHGPGGGGGGGFVALSSVAGVTINVNGGINGTTSPSATSTAPYGSSSSPGGFQVGGVAFTDIPGAAPSPLCYPQLTVTKVTTKPNAVQGGTTSYVITVANAAGHGTATGAVLSDPLPSGLNLATTDNVTLTGGATRTTTSNPTAGATTPAWGAFSIPAGGSVSLAFTVNIPVATALGTLQNGANVAYDDPTRSAAGQTVTPGGLYSTGDGVAGSNYIATSSTAEDVTVFAPVVLSESFNPVSVNAGGSSQLSIQIVNGSTLALTGAAFTDTFPAGLTATGGAVTVAGTGCTGFAPATLAAGATSFALTAGNIPAGATCTITFSVTTAAAQSYTSTIAAGGFTDAQGIGNAAAASATLLTRPTIAKAFAPASVGIGANSTLTFTLANPNAATQLTGATFSDTFPANLIATGGAVTVGGTGCTGFAPTTIAAGATSFALTAGTLPAGGSCTVSFAVNSAISGGYANTAGGVNTAQTVVAGNGSNTATLSVGSVSIAKAFAPATIRSGGTSTVTLTLSNATGTNATGVAFTDTLTGMSINATASAGGTCNGANSNNFTAGATSLSFSAIRVNANSSCTVTFVVKSSTVGTQTNTTSGSTSSLPAGPPSNTAQLVVTGPPTVSIAFSPAQIQTGATSTLTITIVSNDSVPLTAGAFSDVLPAGLFVAGSGTVAAGGTCVGASSNSFTAGTSGATLNFTGLTVPPGSGGCTVTVPISSNTVSPAAGYPDATSAFSSNEAANSAVSNTAQLIVAAPATIAKAFATSPIAQGGTSLLTFTLTNPSNIALTAATFTDNLVNMQVSAAGAAGGTCAGAASNSVTAGQTGTLTFSGLTIPAAASCTVTITVKSGTAGANPNTASGVTSAQTATAGAGSNTAILTVDAPPSLSLGFSPGVILTSSASATSSSTLTITLTNANTVALTGVAFTDTLANMRVFAAGAAGGTCAGAGGNSFTAGQTGLSFSGITVPASGSCTVTVKVASNSISPASGWPNQTSGATSTQTPTAGSPSSSANLIVVGYGTISKAFSPAAISAGGTSTIVFTLTNPNGIDLSAVSFSDAFPANLTTTNVAQNYIGSGRGTCTGAIPSAGSTSVGSVSFTGIVVPAGSSCTVMVDVTSSKTGNYANTASGLTAAETGATAGPASNTVTLAVGSLSLSKSFASASIAAGETSVLTLQLGSSIGGTVSNVNFTDTFPAGLVVASPPNVVVGCGGTLTDLSSGAVSPGDNGISFTNGTIASGGNCTISVNVTAASSGSYANTASAPKVGTTTSGAPSNTATLAVVQKASISEAFSPATVDTYRPSLLTFTLTNPNSGALSGCNLTDALAGFAVTSPASIGGTCTGVTNSPALTAGATALNLTVASLGAGSCTITVPVTSGVAGTYSNAASGVKCNDYVAAGGAPAAASVTFAKLPIQVMKSSNVTSAPPGSSVTYTITYTNPNAAQSLQNIVISDTTPMFTLFTSAACGTLPSSITSCTISSPAVGASGAVTWTLGGTLDAGATGSVTLTVTVQ